MTRIDISMREAAQSKSLKLACTAEVMQTQHLVIWLAACMCASRKQAGVTATHSLPDFHTVTVAAPLNVKIKPSSGFSWDVDAEQQVKNALRASVTNQVLKLESYGDFQSHQPVKITVNLPKDKLIEVNNLASDLVVVDAGFAVATVTATTTGTGKLCFQGIDAHQATISSSG